jgi:phage tail-like protein
MAELALPAVVLERVELIELEQPAMLVDRVPEPGGTNVPLDTSIAFTVLGRGFDPALVRAWVDGQLAHENGSAEPGFAGLRAGMHIVPGGVRITLDPLSPLSSQAQAEVRIEVTLADASTWAETYGFEAADVTSPELVAAQALSTTRVALSFDEAVELADFEATLVALDVPAVPLSVTAAFASGARVELTVQPSMTPAVRYQVSVRGVLDLHGNPILAGVAHAVFTGFRPPGPAGRRFDLWSMLARYNRREDTTGELRRLIACFQEVLDLILAEIDRFAEVLDLERAPEEFVDLMLTDLGNPFDFVLNELEKRRLAAVLVELYRLKGTEKGIRNAARFFLGIELGAIRTYTGSPLVLGRSLLGVNWELGASRRFSLYAFEVQVTRVLTDEERARLRALIEWAKPCHTHLIAIVEPRPIVVVEHWVLGRSALGVETTLS